MTDNLSPSDRAKLASALGALAHVEPGMKLGLGTGSTAAFMVDELGKLVAGGLKVTGVPTSSRTAEQAAGLGIPLSTLEEVGRLDLTIDGADEFDPALNLIKGGGGALLQEKIVASASDRMIVISDASKEVATLGAFPLPVEIVRFGWKSTERHVARLLKSADVGARKLAWRMAGDQPFVTDEGHFILDCHLERIGAPADLDNALNALPGVVESGLFCGIASEVIVGLPDGSTRAPGAG
ncbi:ribose-5-phosphate isomerase RpiA [Rhodobacteraceae bacterium NNCM2]|nr:ribose-5-phosphate isomerase RpiA [Coraliihabitans acroporae]